MEDAFDRPPISLDSCPRLSMMLSLGGTQWSAVKGGPDAHMPSNARMWLSSCFEAKRLLDENGSSELFGDAPLKVRVERDAWLSSSGVLPQAMVDFSSDKLDRLAFVGAKYLAKLTNVLIDAMADHSNKVKVAQIGNKTIKALTDFRHVGPAFFQGGKGEPGYVNFPNSGKVFGEMKPALDATRWSKQDMAGFVACHEFGHAAAKRREDAGEGFYGLDNLGADPELSKAVRFMGLDRQSPSDMSALGCQVRPIFQEGYADLFAAMALGNGDLSTIKKSLGSISAFRSAYISERADQYFGKSVDVDHDTREAITAMVERLDARGIPKGAQEIHEACLDCALRGSMRWFICAVAQSDEMRSVAWDHADWALARRVPSAVEIPTDQEGYAKARSAAMGQPSLEQYAKGYPEDNLRGSPEFVVGLAMVGEAAKACGSPRHGLGSKSNPPGAGLPDLPLPLGVELKRGVISKLFAKRSSSAPAALPDPVSAPAPAKLG